VGVEVRGLPPGVGASPLTIPPSMTQGVVVLSDLGDGTGVLTLIDPATGETTEVEKIEGEPRDLVQGLDDLWVSAYGADALIRIPSLP
jgi:hypothetical protein